MSSAEWVEPLVRGAGGLLLAAAVFAVARLRFSRGGGPGAGNDVGLD